jgi:hypothetical protein
MANKILVEMLSKSGENLGFKKAVLGTDGLATLGRGEHQRTFKVQTNSYIRHSKKGRNYVRWQEGSPNTLTLTETGDDPVITDVELDMVARNTFARDAYAASKAKGTSEKIQAIAMWVLIGVLILGAFVIANELGQLGDTVGRLVPTPTPSGTVRP